MSLVRPFSGRVVTQPWGSRVISPPHDVLTAAERQSILSDNPDSYLHVTSDPQDLPERPDGRAAGANAIALQRLLDLGAYSPPVDRALFAYRMSEPRGGHTGLVAQVAVRGFADGRVRGHEAVQPDRVAGLVRHFDAVPRRSELVSLVHRDDHALAELTAQVCADAPILQLTDLGGVEQSVWQLDARRLAEVAPLLDALPHYIADGHHRVAASLRRWRRDGEPEDSTVLSAIYPAAQISVYSFHRRVHGPVAASELLSRLHAEFSVSSVAAPTQETGSFGMYVDGQWFRLTPRQARHQAGVAGLDVTVLDGQVLGPLLGVDRGDPRLVFIPELRDLPAGLSACDADGGVMFTLQAPGMDDLFTVADRGEVMSAKTTYVQPKPRSGIFLQ